MNLRARAAERWAQEASRLRRFLETGELVERELPTCTCVPNGIDCGPDCPCPMHEVDEATAARLGMLEPDPEETYFVDVDGGEHGPARPGV